MDASGCFASETFYERRASVCRDFVPSWADGEHNERCDKAREKFGLPPLKPEDWTTPEDPDYQPAA